jgi:hypothetical protein
MSLVLTPGKLDTWFSSDSQMHLVYPESIRLLAHRHWTPLAATRMMAQFLALQTGVKILDIGSGVGKFCLAGAYYQPSASFFGVEQRKDLVNHAETARKILGMGNAHFLHANFTELDFAAYDHFYFYNSFYENLDGTDKIDDKIGCSSGLYNYYNRCLYKKLEATAPGTRLATFHYPGEKMPPSFHLAEELAGGAVKCWIRE